MVLRVMPAVAARAFTDIARRAFRSRCDEYRMALTALTISSLVIITVTLPLCPSGGSCDGFAVYRQSVPFIQTDDKHCREEQALVGDLSGAARSASVGRHRQAPSKPDARPELDAR